MRNWMPKTTVLRNDRKRSCESKFPDSKTRAPSTTLQLSLVPHGTHMSYSLGQPKFEKIPWEQLGHALRWQNATHGIKVKPPSCCKWEPACTLQNLASEEVIFQQRSPSKQPCYKSTQPWWKHFLKTVLQLTRVFSRSYAFFSYLCLRLHHPL